MKISPDVLRHDELVPMGTQVSSKSRYRNCRGFGPEWGDFATGAVVNNLIDWSCGLGSITLGHNMHYGHKPQSLPLPNIHELDLAKLLNDWIPCADMVRFLKTGTDATSACIRLARVCTGRDIIADAGNYHGWADWSLAPEHEGVPQCIRDLTKRIAYNDLEAAESLLRQCNVAALILEPVSLISPKIGYLQGLRRLCTETGTVLVFDEVITGIRMTKGGAQETYGVIPDLCAIGKGMANGYAISAVCGKECIMDCWSKTHISGTHFGDPSCMIAAIETMKELEENNFWDHQSNIGSQMLFGVHRLIDEHGLQQHAKAIGHAHWWVLQIPNPEYQTLVQQTLIENGVLGSNGSHFVSLAHTQGHVLKSLDAYDKAFSILAHGIKMNTVESMLKCEVNKITFRRT